METPIVNNSGTSIILEYILKNTSWREVIFRKLTIGQKILFFLPIPFLYLSIYGAFDLFHNNSWILFILFGLLMLLSIWTFFKIKAALENRVFEKLYSSGNCKTILEYHIENLTKLLGEQNTSENRALWKDYFKYKPNKFPIFITPFIFGLIFFQIIAKPHDKDNLLVFYLGWFTLMIMLMTFAFIMPAITDIKFKRTTHNYAFKIVSEMDKLTKE
jgi:hypothetical protein